jgi:hypothetical protein
MESAYAQYQVSIREGVVTMCGEKNIYAFRCEEESLNGVSKLHQKSQSSSKTENAQNTQKQEKHTNNKQTKKVSN